MTTGPGFVLPEALQGPATRGATILPYKGQWPRISPEAYIANGCQVIGDVDIAEDVGVWFNCVIRGDEHAVRIGARTNIQDGTVIHVHSLKQGTMIGADVTVGHMALLLSLIHI